MRRHGTTGKGRGGPDGARLSGPGRDDALVAEVEQILCGDLDFDAIADMKMIVDSAGHFARPDVARLLLRRAPQAPIKTS